MTVKSLQLIEICVALIELKVHVHVTAAICIKNILETNCLCIFYIN